MDNARIGNFTSSKIFNLMTLATNKIDFGKPALTYIKQKCRERKLKIEYELESNSFPTSWGRAVESYVFKKYIPISFKYESDKTTTHSSGMWVGTKDVLSKDTVGDIKCPFTRNSFCDLVEVIQSNDPEFFKKNEPEYYWQLVSNAMLENTDFAQLFVFMPYYKELPALFDHFGDIDDYNLQKDIQWAIHAETNRVPHLPDNSDYTNFYSFRFEVPTKDKELLLSKITKAYDLIIK